jgi:hypothetical protein
MRSAMHRRLRRDMEEVDRNSPWLAFFDARGVANLSRLSVAASPMAQCAGTPRGGGVGDAELDVPEAAPDPCVSRPNFLRPPRRIAASRRACPLQVLVAGARLVPSCAPPGGRPRHTLRPRTDASPIALIAL